MARPKTVAIVGFAPSTRHLAPVNDPEIEIWSLNEAYVFLSRCDRWFQMHPRWEWDQSLRDAGYVEWLRACKQPIYMHEVASDIPMSLRYPIEMMIAAFGEYLTSSFSYMLAMAIHEGFEEIQVFGVDLATDEEYGFQRAGAEYLLGVAHGKGINIVLPEACPLLKSPLYGVYAKEAVRSLFTKGMIESRGEVLTAQYNAALQATHTLNGALQDAKHWLEAFAGKPEGDLVAAQFQKLQQEMQEKHAATLEIQGAIKEANFWMGKLMGEVRADANRSGEPPAEEAIAPVEPTVDVQASDGSGNRRRAKELVHAD